MGISLGPKMSPDYLNLVPITIKLYQAATSRLKEAVYTTSLNSLDIPSFLRYYYGTFGSNLVDAGLVTVQELPKATTSLDDA